MAIGTNVFSTYDAVGNREDLIDMIHNIAPVETWFTSNTSNVQAGARYHEWQTDTLASPTANAVVEGNSVTVCATTATTRLGNYVQILEKSFSVSRTQENVKAAGRPSEIAYQKAQKTRELANDIEYALIINSAAVSGGTATARKMCGVLGFVSTNVTTATTALTASGVDESSFNTNLGLIWAQGGKPSNVLCGSIQKRSISAFTGNNTRFISMEKSMVEAAVDVYKSDFGNVTIHLHYIMNGGAAGSTVVLGEMKLWRKAWLSRPQWTELGILGAFRGFFIQAELTLESGQQLGSGKLTGFKSS